MRLPLRLPEYRRYQRWLAATVIAVVCATFGVALWTPAKVLGAVGMLDHVFYDSLYKFRPWDSQVRSSIVIIAVDAISLDAMDKDRKVGWPWPRKYWGEVVTYLDAAGAKAIVFDLLFDKTSVYEKFEKDDQQFGEAIDASATPVIMAATAVDERTMTLPTPPITNRRTLGAINFEGESIVRTYQPVFLGHDSLALATVKRLGIKPPPWATEPFLLRYYGPHADRDGPVTFRYVQAARAVAAYEDADKDTPAPLPPDFFKDKIVLIGAITKGTYDQKSSPLSSIYPGTEVHATALQNILANERITPSGTLARLAVLMLGCFVSAIGTVIPGRVPLKLVGGIAGLMIVLSITASLFLDNNVRWMPPSAALFAAMLSAFVGLSYSYLTELRQRRFILKAFAQSVSKEVADEIAKDPRKLGLGGQRRDMTVMFTDLANFTALTESIKDERLTAVLQFYLEEMSGVVLGVNGTVDKYIGDAIMAFWNAPTNQPDHAVRACRAALEMRRREAAIQPRLMEMSGVKIYSRIGINSGTMVVGNLGSTFKFSYTVIGDSVNLASRLEGANKMYGTRILLSETTAAIVKEHFVLRKLDLLAVKGKAIPIEVSELIAEQTAGAPPPPPYIAPFETALAHYQQRRFEEAQEILIALKKDFPDDGPTDTLLGRVIEYIENPPEPEWNGVYVAKEK